MQNAIFSFYFTKDVVSTQRTHAQRIKSYKRRIPGWCSEKISNSEQRSGVFLTGIFKSRTRSHVRAVAVQIPDIICYKSQRRKDDVTLFQPPVEGS